MILQGDLYWIDLMPPAGSGSGFRHPFVVVQNNIVNRSLINTVIVCLVTSNLQRAKAPGNILLEENEAGLPKRSVVNVSQLFTVDKRELGEKIGTLSRRRINLILEGIRLLTDPAE